MPLKRHSDRLRRAIGDTISSAAKSYLDRLRKDIGDKKMNKILSAQGDSTLMFAIDTTASMYDEIQAAKAIAKAIISVTRDFEVDYILSPFNDPGKIYICELRSSLKITLITDLIICVLKFPLTLS